jgi:hypothetical protein
MKNIAIVFAAVMAIGLMTCEAQAQNFYRGHGNNFRGGGTSFSLSIGNGGFYGPRVGNFGNFGGFGGFPNYGGGFGVSYARPVYVRPVYSVPIYRGYGGGFGGGYYGGGYRGGYRSCGGRGW